MSEEWAVAGGFVTAYLVFSLALQLAEQYLEYRQYLKHLVTEVPPELATLGVEVDEDEFLKNQDYQKDKRIFKFIKTWVMFAWSLLSLMYITPALWHHAMDTFGYVDYWEYKVTLYWMFLQQWVEKPLGIPFSLYSNFVVEERHGFNKMTMKLFFTDMVKSELLSYLFGGLLIPVLIWVVNSTGNRFYLYVWALMQMLIIAMMFIYPNYIAPLFNKFETLKDEDLKQKIEVLAAEHNFPLTKLFQIDGSTRSSHSNAYFFGFWKNKRIVLYDTLLHLDHEDILAILCHELGHWWYNHITFNLVITSLQIFVIFFLFGQVMYSEGISESLVSQFGYGDTQAVMVKLMIFTMLFEPVQTVLQLFMTLNTRKFEFQADQFALEQGRQKALASGLKAIHAENKGDLNPDEWYSWYHFSHPPLVERLSALLNGPGVIPDGDWMDEKKDKKTSWNRKKTR